MLEAGFSTQDVVVLTSTQPSDDPVAAYASSIGCPVFRGPLEDVMGRFAGAIEQFPCDWILRATADSPVCRPEVIRWVTGAAEGPFSFITTTHRRTLPCGTNIEAFRASLLLERLSAPGLTAEDREHVTRNFHEAPPRGGIASLELAGSDFSGTSVAIDSPEDLNEMSERDPSRILEEIPWHQLELRPLPTT